MVFVRSLKRMASGACSLWGIGAAAAGTPIRGRSWSIRQYVNMLSGQGQYVAMLGGQGQYVTMFSCQSQWVMFSCQSPFIIMNSCQGQSVIMLSAQRSAVKANTSSRLNIAPPPVVVGLQESLDFKWIYTDFQHLQAMRQFQNQNKPQSRVKLQTN